MPSSTTYRSDGSAATHYVGADKSDDDIAKAQSTSRLTDTSRLGALGKKGGRGPRPQQGDYATLAEFGAAIRKWQETPEVEGQKRALSRLAGK